MEHCEQDNLTRSGSYSEHAVNHTDLPVPPFHGIRETFAVRP